ncbi:MAG: DUF5668 domain-containing protein [Dehalococcoidales bacterium]
MSEEKQPGKQFVPIWGILLLFLGTVFLLQTFSILSWGIWDTLWRFWPVLLIMAGLGVLLRRFNVWLVSLLMVALLLACLGIAVWQDSSPDNPAVNNNRPKVLALFASITSETANGIGHLSL